ncbi:MAG: cobalamin B12-binding domain-containing protein [Deltaproteobacteria bacterium]|nr:cobalamin B12-binding domain-containing protein [Deltaproteobacteria bacterium]
MRVGLVGPEIEENLALRSIAASLKAAGHEPRIFDFREAAQIPELALAITRWAPELVGLSMIFTARSDELVDLAAALRSVGYRGHLTAGGHFAALHAAEILRDCPALDSIVAGEGEEPMVELARDHAAAARVPGLTVRGAGGETVRTAPRPSIDDLDARPWSIRPDRFHQYLGRGIASLLASRGCWASCHFCSILAFHSQCGGGKRYRQRRIDAVADEMAHLFHDRGARIYNFQDDNFLVPSKRANLERMAGLREALRERGVGRIAIQAKTRPDCVDDEVVELLQSMGLFRFFLGIETDAVVGLKTLGRGIEREQNHRALAILRRRGVHTCFNLLIFDPESTLDALQQNVDFMRRQSWFPLNFCRVEVYGGTAIEARLRKEGRLVGDYRGYSYAIADPRAELAFQVFREVFWPRNFGPGGLQHEVMKADYVFHLLRHFHPERASRPLERRVKGIVRDLNANSAELMDRILGLAASSRWSDPAAVAAEIEALCAARRAADLSIGGRITDVVRVIEGLAAAVPERRTFLQTAVAAGAAAALVATTPACGGTEQSTHMCEMAPPPREAVTSPMPAHERAALTEQINELARTGLRHLFGQFQLLTTPVPIDILVNGQGDVLDCEVRLAGDDVFARELCRAITEKQYSAVHEGGSGQITVQVEVPPPQPPDDTHMCEMAPMPQKPRG